MSVDTNEIKQGYDKAYIEKISKDLNEPDWLLELRYKGLELAEDLPLPVTEKTKINKWNFTAFDHQVAPSTVTKLDELPEEILSLIGKEEESGNLLVQHNTSVIHNGLTEELKNKGVIYTDLKTAVQEHGDLVKKYFMTNGVKVDEHRLTALHTAYINGGTFLYVPKNVEIDVPLQAVYWIDNEKVGLFNHVIIVAETNSKLTYVENYLSTNNESKAVVNVVTEVYAGPNAKVLFGAVDNLSSGVTTYINRRGMIDRDGRIEWALGQMNDGNTVSDNTTKCIGDGSSTDTKTVSIGRGEQRQNFNISTYQIGLRTDAQILAHGVMKDSASSIFNGIAKIEHGATKANSEQTERVLMLSEKARGDANPILLIDEDDVLAGHAASVGRVDPVQLYYLMSRGITKAEAEHLIIYGFLAPVVTELPIEGVQKALLEVIERKVR